jgi:hypothetical protein
VYYEVWGIENAAYVYKDLEIWLDNGGTLEIEEKELKKERGKKKKMGDKKDKESKKEKKKEKREKKEKKGSFRKMK